jgi:hypothetical protein
MGGVTLIAWTACVLGLWLLVAATLALVLGRAVRLRDTLR